MFKVKFKSFLSSNIFRIIIFIVVSMIYMHIFREPNTNEPIWYFQNDAFFNYSRVLSLENIFESPVNFKYFSHNAHMVNMFYPWLTVFPFFKIMQHTNNLILAYYIFMFLMTFLTLEITYQVSYRISNKNKSLSFLTAIIYMFSLTRTINVYHRIALGETVSMTFLPIVLYGCYKIFYDKQPKWYMLAIGMTLIAYTHMLSLVMSVTLVSFFFIMSIINRKLNKQRFFELIKATVFSLLMTAGFFIPMLQMQKAVEIKEPKIYDLISNAPSLDNIINSSLANNLSGNDTLGIAMIILFGVTIFQFKKISNILYRDLFIASIVFIIIGSNVFPWTFLQEYLYQIQFPWRFFVIATLTLSFVGSLAITKLVKNSNIKSTICIILVCLIGLHYSTIYRNEINAKNANYVHNQNYYWQLINGRYFNGIFDYTPMSAHIFEGENYDIRKLKVKFNDNDWRYVYTKFYASKIEFTINNNDINQKSVILPVFKYPGEEVKLNDKKIKFKRAYNGTTKVPLKYGKNVFSISYKYTKLAIISKIISLTSMILVGILYLKDKLLINRKVMNNNG